MKTNKIKLLATMVTLAAVIITTANPAAAQRRQSKNERTETRVQRSGDRRSVNQNQVQHSTRKSENHKSASKSEIKRNTQRREDISKGTSSSSSRSQQQRIVRENRTSSDRGGANSRNDIRVRTEVINTAPQRSERSSTGNRENQRDRNSSVIVNSNHNNTQRGGRDAYRSGSQKTTSDNLERRTTGVKSRDHHEIYRIDRNDKRYTPTRDYRGSKQVWTENRRPGNMNYNRRDRDYYKNYNYWNHKHWDRNWERYRWNFYSWRDYYHGYNPYSYRYDRYYYHHPVYGHVIRKFVYRPNVFIHNHYQYYCYDGHFFRYLRGVGYVLVDIPFGIVFNELPYEYERVYINGYLYFRVGNLFFEMTDFGFQLVHYPERYYSFDNGYINEGYYFGDDLNY